MSVISLLDGNAISFFDHVPAGEVPPVGSVIGGQELLVLALAALHWGSSHTPLSNLFAHAGP